MLGTGPDLLRLLAVPVFGWTAYRDIETRRVPNRTWYPLAVLGFLALVWETYRVATDPFLFVRPFAIRVALSLLVLVPLAYLFWRIGGFGGADVKALWVLALLFPTFPHYTVGSVTIPAVTTRAGVFSMTVLTNTVVIGLTFPVALAVRNLLAGDVGSLMFLARQVRPERAVEEYGAMLRPAPAETGPLGAASHYLSMRASKEGLDLDALRMYLQWRGVSLARLRADPDRFRDPASLPADPNPPGDGSMAASEVAIDGGGEADATHGDSPGTDTGVSGGRSAGGDDGETDPWGAAAFLDDIEGSAYGTTPANLRWGLETLTTAESVWLSPGTPFLVPLFVGLLAGLTYGDLLFGLLGLLGVV